MKAHIEIFSDHLYVAETLWRLASKNDIYSRWLRVAAQCSALQMLCICDPILTIEWSALVDQAHARAQLCKQMNVPDSIFLRKQAD